MPVDPLTTTALTAAGKFALKKAIELLPDNSRRVAETWEAMLHDMVLAFDQALRAHLAHHEATDPRYSDRLAAALGEREARALFYRLAMEGAQATTTERMRMLAHALAGLYTPDLGGEMRSRVSRAVVMLEPSDVAILRKAVAADDARNVQVEGTEFRLAFPLTPTREYEGLKAVGCIQDDNETRGGLYVTELGRAVLKALELWRQDGATTRNPSPEP